MEQTPYVSLANKYRPQTFEDMVGQESISKTLQNALKLGRVGHAYLFYGPRGCGKTTTARILAKALNCTGHGQNGPTPSPCGECPSCKEIAQSADLDVLELDAASNTQVEKVREAIIDTVALASSRDRFKVFILDEVHMLSASSFNALLKTIEEPPAHVVFILATTEKHKVPATIVSRCQTFRFRPLTTEEISDHLMELAEVENIDLTAAAAKIIAKNAGGAMRDALTLLDRAIAFAGNRIDEKLVGEMLGLTPDELIKEALDALIHKNNTQLHRVFETLKNEGFDANAFLKDIKNALGDAFYYSLGQGKEPFDGAKALLAEVSPGFLAQLSRKVNKLMEEVKFSDAALISAEVGLFTVMDSVMDIEGFIRRLEALENGTSTTDLPAGPTQSQKKSGNSASAKATQKTVAQAVPPTVQDKTSFTEIAAIDTTISNRQIWDKMLKLFEKSPFVYDVMLNGMIEFKEENRWVLSFPAGKEFYQIPAQNKLEELSAAASKISGRTIQIVLADTKLTKSSQTTMSKTVSPKRKATAKTNPTPVVISEEEPFVAGNFEKDSLSATTVPADKVPEEVKGIMEIFPGELMA
ncbi:MAG: DNA polymerase III subunit gamma/tau [Elusimicrobiaceae bacterium]|nr:DNA polymerase III subunit gamma/tau [Elusimicrobiaceae bacterium]